MWGMKFWKTILATFSRPQDIILQRLPDGPLLPALGKASGRHILQADADSTFLESIKSSQEILLKDIVKNLPLTKRQKL